MHVSWNENDDGEIWIFRAEAASSKRIRFLDDDARPSCCSLEEEEDYSQTKDIMISCRG